MFLEALLAAIGGGNAEVEEGDWEVIKNDSESRKIPVQMADYNYLIANFEGAFPYSAAYNTTLHVEYSDKWGNSWLWEMRGTGEMLPEVVSKGKLSTQLYHTWHYIAIKLNS